MIGTSNANNGRTATGVEARSSLIDAAAARAVFDKNR